MQCSAVPVTWNIFHLSFSLFLCPAVPACQSNMETLRQTLTIMFHMARLNLLSIPNENQYQDEQVSNDIQRHSTVWLCVRWALQVFLLTYLLTINQTKHQMSLNASVHRDACLFPACTPLWCKLKILLTLYFLLSERISCSSGSYHVTVGCGLPDARQYNWALCPVAARRWEVHMYTRAGALSVTHQQRHWEMFTDMT